jgi:hypothetical protein
MRNSGAILTKLEEIESWMVLAEIGHSQNQSRPLRPARWPLSYHVFLNVRFPA